jgi:hypothetical protein
MGFNRCILPAGSLKRMKVPAGLQAVGVRTISEAVETLF